MIAIHILILFMLFAAGIIVGHYILEATEEYQNKKLKENIEDIFNRVKLTGKELDYVQEMEAEKAGSSQNNKKLRRHTVQRRIYHKTGKPRKRHYKAY